MSERIREYLLAVTTTETRRAAEEVLDDTGETALEHAIRMAVAGQPYLALDYVYLALRAGDIDGRQAAELLAAGFDALASLERAPTEAANCRQDAQRLRDVGTLPIPERRMLTETEKQELEEFTERVRKKLPLVKIIKEPNEGACEARGGEVGSASSCGFPGGGSCRFPDTDQTNCSIWREWNK